MPRHLHTDPDEHINDIEHEDLIDDLVDDIKEYLNNIIHDEDLETLRKVRNVLRDPEMSCEDVSPKLKEVLEGYRPIPMRTRMFYPRGFKLSEAFVDAFHAEYDRLMGEGLNPKNLLDRFGKALKFHVNEARRYKNPVVEAEKKEDKKEGIKVKASSSWRDAHENEEDVKDKPKSTELGKNIQKWSKDQS